MSRTRRLVQLAVTVAALCVCGTAWSAAKTYVVRPNEGWFQIAQSHGVTMKDLLVVNHATRATKLHAGQKLQLPAATHPKAAKAAPPKPRPKQ
jgi:LysM repeat protein